MNIRSICLFLTLLALGCKRDNSIALEPVTYTGDTCTDCPNIKITVPNALGDAGIDKAVNTALKEELIYLLNFDDQQNATDINSAIESFITAYTNLKAEFAEEATPWEAAVTAAVSYEDDHFITIKMDSYLFTGGAHGYNTTHYLNFDKLKALELNTDELFKHMPDFESYAESKFRSQQNIPSKADINSTGFMFETGSFYLPENIGYTKEGLQLFYEQYEIASYADGPVVLTFPYAELKPYLVYYPAQK